MNTADKKIPKPLFVFYLLVAYVFVQFCWWTWLLFDLNYEVFSLKKEIFLNDSVTFKSAVIEEGLHKKRLMIVGEGFVFLTLLILGIIQTRKSFRRETALANQQNNFILSVTHELKSPLASIKLFLQTIDKREIDREKQKRLTASAIEEVNRLNQLIENILLANQINSDVFSLKPERLNLSEFLGETTRKYTQFNLHSLPVELIIDQDIWIYADRTALVSVFENILENAFKYAGESKTIKISLKREAGFAITRIIDDGPGISDEIKSQIFEKFYRGGDEETRAFSGTGLGLFIVKNLVKQHGGSVRVLDNKPKGSIFEIRLPEKYEE